MASFRLVVGLCLLALLVVVETASTGLTAGTRSVAPASQVDANVSLETIEQVMGQKDEDVPLQDADMRPHRMVYRTLRVPKRRRRVKKSKSKSPPQKSSKGNGITMPPRNAGG